MQFDIMRSWQLAFHSVALAFAQDADAGVGTTAICETTFRTSEPGSWTICREMVNEGEPLSRLDAAFADARLVFRHLCGECDWNNFCGGAYVYV